MTQTAIAPSRELVHEPRFSNTLASEWTKLRTLRSTPITLAVTAVLVIGLSALIAWGVVNSPHHGRRFITDPISLVQAGWGLGLLAFIVLGVLVISNEYSSGMVASTFLATPKRARVLVAKVAVFAVLVFVVAELMSFLDYFLAHALVSSHPQFSHTNLGDHNVLRAVVGMGISATEVGLMGLGLGALLRHTAGAITAGVAITFVGPIIVAILPSSWGNPIGEYWPTMAGSQLEEVSRQANALSAWWGSGDMALFVVVLLGVAGYLLVRRDS
jgi:hypothetical protein